MEVNNYILKIPHPKDEFQFVDGVGTVPDKTSSQENHRFLTIFSLPHNNPLTPKI